MIFIPFPPIEKKSPAPTVPSLSHLTYTPAPTYTSHFSTMDNK